MNNQDMIQMLQSIIAADKTPEYEYGANATNNAGIEPPTGSRWLTPKEICREAIRDLKDGLDE